MKKKLLHIMMGTHNPNLREGLDSVFECVHFDWTIYVGNPYQLQNDILGIFNNFKPDYVFMHLQSGDVINTETARIMACNSVVVNWTGDVRHPLQQFYFDIGRNIHSTLFTNMNDVETCKEKGVKADFLQVGFDSIHFNPFGSTDGKYPEIVFLGSNYSNNPFPLSQLRYDMVSRLKSEFGNKFGFYGGGWHGYEDGNITSYEEEGKLYRSCKIAINLSHFAYKRYSSDRLFRILGSGAFCLTHYYPEIEVDFKVGKDLVVWNNIDDLVQKIKRYLKRDSERERIAISGCFNARTNFTWHHFAQNLEKIFNKIKQEKDERIILG